MTAVWITAVCAAAFDVAVGLICATVLLWQANYQKAMRGGGK